MIGEATRSNTIHLSRGLKFLKCPAPLVYAPKPAP